MQKTTFTLAEAAQLLHCHKETLRRAILDGSLQAARLGRGYRISRADLQKFWTDRGGGALFEQGIPIPSGTENTVENKGEASKGKPKKSQGPHQLTLPTS